MTKILITCLVKKWHVILMGLLFALCIASISLTLAFGLPNILNKKEPLPTLETPPAPSASPLRRFSRAAIAADASECAEIGRRMLQRNGTAVDAAVAALFCVGVINSQSAGIGGGMLMTLYERDRRAPAALLAREVAPAAASRDMFVDSPGDSQHGWRAAGVPGQLAGMWAAHEKYGRLPWRDLVQPSVQLCRRGFAVNKHLSAYLEMKDIRDLVFKDKAMRSMFFNVSSGQPWAEGDLIRCPVLADTLEAIADGGAAALYGGNVGEKLVKDIQSNGGIITMEDLRQYKPRWVQPVSTTLSDGISVYGVPPPGSSALLMFILNIFDQYQYSKRPPKTKEELDLMYHRIAEAYKYAFARRTELADPQFVNITELVSNLTAPAYAASVRRRLDDTRTFSDPKRYGVHVAPVSDSGTSHMSVIDRDGNAVSVTSSINLHFGAKVMSASTGIILNDQMDDFSTPGVKNYFHLPPSSANFIEPGKMMVSSMSPVVLVDAAGDVRLVSGASGGTLIITAVAQTAIRHLYMGADVKQANDFPRLHHQLFPMTLFYEPGFPATTIAYLSTQGHNMEVWNKKAAVVVLSRQNDVIEGNLDFRKGAGDVMGL